MRNDPPIEWFPAEGAKAAVAVLPGGGYWILADHEGEPIARWLNTLGLSAAVVKYRRADTGQRHPAPLRDAMAGVRFCRDHCATVGVLGFSAGGHLAATVSTATDHELAEASRDASSRPDFSVLCYPVISLSTSVSHGGSRDNLLGDRRDDKTLVESLDADKRVTESTPPAFIYHTAFDDAVPVENAFLYARALRAAGVGFSLHVTDDSAKAGHGSGLADAASGREDALNATWTHHCAAWLRKHGWATK